jgi:DNA-binding NtrC family response regulator
MCYADKQSTFLAMQVYLKAPLHTEVPVECSMKAYADAWAEKLSALIGLFPGPDLVLVLRFNLIEEACRRCCGNLTQAGNLLGVKRTTLFEMLKRANDYPAFRRKEIEEFTKQAL